MRSLLIFGMLIPLALSSCKSENQTPKTHQFPGPPPVELMDQDRDGISDPYEAQQNTSSRVATFPTFSTTEKVETQLSLSEKSINAKELIWKTSLKDQRPPLYRPHRNQMAKMSYQKDFKFQENNEHIKYSPLPIFQLTSVLFHQWHELKNFTIAANPYLSLQSKLTLSLKNFDGIREVNNISGRIGFYEKDQFIPLTNRFILKDEVGKVLSLGSKKETNTAFLSIEINQPKLIERFLSAEAQIMIELIDYEAFTLENSNYSFTKQWSYAAKDNRPLLISYPGQDQIYLIDKSLSLKEALQAVSNDLSFNKENKLEGINGFNNERTSNTTLDKMDSLQLQERSWQSYEQEDLLSLAFLSSLELAQAQQELIVQSEFKIEENTNQIRLGKLRIGESFSIQFRGNYKLPQVSLNESIKDITYTKVEIYQPGPVREPTGMPRRIEVQRQTTCITTTQVLEWSEHRIDSAEIISFATFSNQSISLEELFQALESRPVFHKDTQTFELQFTINEQFLDFYGDELLINVMDQRTEDQLVVGTMDVQCEDSMPSNFDFAHNFGAQEVISPEQRNQIVLNLLKTF